MLNLGALIFGYCSFPLAWLSDSKSRNLMPKVCVGRQYCASRGVTVLVFASVSVGQSRFMRLTRPGSSQRAKVEGSSPRLREAISRMKHTCSAKGKNRLVFGFRPRENVIFPGFSLTKGKNCSILGFQQAFLSWLPIPR